MMNPNQILQEINEHIKKLNPEEQRRVLEFTKELEFKPLKGVSGQSLLSFEGTIDKKDLELMRQAIEEDCEKVSPNEW